MSGLECKMTERKARSIETCREISRNFIALTNQWWLVDGATVAPLLFAKVTLGVCLHSDEKLVQRSLLIQHRHDEGDQQIFRRSGQSNSGIAIVMLISSHVLERGPPNGRCLAGLVNVCS